MTLLTKRQVLLRYGFNAKTFSALVESGIVCEHSRKEGKRPTIFFSYEHLQERLIEGEHYILCKECGAFQNMISPRHLKACSGVSLKDYVGKFPEAPLMSAFTRGRKAKSEGQKEAQSEKLKKRFQTPVGEITRQQISEASKRMQAGPYREQAAAHLTALNKTPEYRELRRQQSKERWENGDLREAVEGWHRDNKELSLEMAKQARRHIKKKRTKLHLEFKERMIEFGLVGFETEHEVGYYSIDEAIPELKLSVEINGCYWHSCPECKLTGPKGTLTTDKSKATYLRNRGWTLLAFWEHEIRQDPESCLKRIRKAVLDLEDRGRFCNVG